MQCFVFNLTVNSIWLHFTNKKILNFFAGPVVYDTSQFLCTNRDVLHDDLITVFGKESCQFGFASHLFATELRNLQNNQPRGACFRISPTAGTSTGMCNV